jgi:cell division transport system permease protein
MSKPQVVQPKTKKGGVSYASVIFGVAMVLLLLGILGWVFIHANQFLKTVKESIQVEVQMNDNTRDELGKKLMDNLKQYEFTKNAEYITKEQAAKDYQLNNNENFEEVIEINPLYSSIILHLTEPYIQQDSLVRIKQLIMKSNIVREVDYKTTLVNIVNNKLRAIGLALLGITALLVMLVIFLIDNTIRLAMYSNRFLIKTMQLVGATRWFIAKPFNMRAVINGLISSLIAIGGVMLVQGWLKNVIPEINSLQSTKSTILLYLGLVIIGIAISVFSTNRSVTKYLKTSLDDLY